MALARGAIDLTAVPPMRLRVDGPSFFHQRSGKGDAALLAYQRHRNRFFGKGNKLPNMENEGLLTLSRIESVAEPIGGHKLRPYRTNHVEEGGGYEVVATLHELSNQICVGDLQICVIHRLCVSSQSSS